MALQSEFKTNAQLVACAQSDPEHIGEFFNPKGAHVILIKKALNLWLSRESLPKKPLPLDMGSDVFDSKVGDMVFLYKRLKNIRNYQKEIDRIVGKKTVEALDKELPIIIPEIIVVGHLIDIVVEFAGALTKTPKELEPETVLPSASLANYLRNIGEGKLLRIGHQTTGIGPDTKAIRDKMHQKIDEARVDFAVRNVFVFGTSSGGRNAIDFANELAAEDKDIATTYLAVSDPAFFPQETATVPDGVPDPTNVPVFNVNVKAKAGKTRKSFFQIVGNKSKKTLTLSRRVLFTSDMDNQEIHGAVGGFLPFNLSSSVAPKVTGLTGKQRDDQAHIELSRIALRTIRGDIASILNSL